jgi:hypothetical protein
MLTKTIGQLDSTLITDGTEYVEIEQSGASKKTTVQNIVYSGLPVGMLVMSEFDEATSATWPAVPRNVDIDITPANYPLLATKLYDVKASILGTADFDGVVSSVNTTMSMFTFTAATAATALCSLLVEDAKVSRWMNLDQDATAPSVVDFVTSATSRCINIGGTDYPIYPSTAASAISVTSGTIIFEGKPSAGSSIAAVYTYRIPGTTNVRLRKIAGFVGVAAGDAGGEVVGGFRKMDRMQPITGQATIRAGSSTTAGDYSNGVFSNSVKTSDRPDGTIAGGAYGPLDFNSANSPNARTGKTTDPRTAGQYAYTWAGVYTP